MVFRPKPPIHGSAPGAQAISNTTLVTDGENAASWAAATAGPTASAKCARHKSILSGYFCVYARPGPREPAIMTYAVARRRSHWIHDRPSRHSHPARPATLRNLPKTSGARWPLRQPQTARRRGAAVGQGEGPHRKHQLSFMPFGLRGRPHGHDREQRRIGAPALAAPQRRPNRDPERRRRPAGRHADPQHQAPPALAHRLGHVARLVFAI